MLAYLPPPDTGAVGVAMVFVGHLLFRTAYAAVNDESSILIRLYGSWAGCKELR